MSFREKVIKITKENFNPLGKLLSDKILSAAKEGKFYVKVRNLSKADIASLNLEGFEVSKTSDHIDNIFLISWSRE